MPGMPEDMVRKYGRPYPAFVYWMLPACLLVVPPSVALAATGVSNRILSGILIVTALVPLCVCMIPIWVRMFGVCFDSMAHQFRGTYGALEQFQGGWVGFAMLFRLDPELSARHPFLKYWWYGSFILVGPVMFASATLCMIFVAARA